MPHRLVLALLVLLLPLRALAHGGSHDALPSDAIVPGGFVSNFRLTDHRGVTRELFYESKAKAIVFVFSGTGHPRAAQTAAALAAMRARFSATDVVIWQIDSNLGADRTAIAAEQTANGNDTPVLFDAAQLVAGEYVSSHQLETFVVATANWTLVYRGPLDNGDPATTAAPTQHYASDAAAAVVAGSTTALPLITMPHGARPLELPPAAIPDYATDVAPILLRSCVQCHSAGNIGEYAMTKYDDLLQRAAQIRGDLLTKKMTPWHADPQYGVFSNSSALTPVEIATLFSWTRAGAPRGTGPDPLVTTPPPAGGDWPLGQPDMIVTIPQQTLPATGIIPYKYVTTTVPVTTDRWLRAAVVKPGNKTVVHHALVFEGLEILTFDGGLGGFFAGYVPGMLPTFYPDGVGKLIHRNAAITFQIHYTTTGKVETDQTSIGLYFSPGPPERELLTRAAYTRDLTIPAGTKEYEREVSITPSTTKDVMLYELNPHMHYRGKRFKYEALYPDGTSEVLLNVPQYDFHWQSQYRLAAPKRLPAGTIIRTRGAFDNSPENPDNPNANAIVAFGEQTNDEMFVGYLNYAEIPAAGAPPPVFTANLAARARVGEAFSLTVRAANTVTAYRAAAALPAGLSLDAATGAIAGTPQAAGRTAITVYADNASGSAAVVVDLVVSAAAAQAPSVTTQPTSQAVNAGASVTLAAAGSGTPTFQWQRNGSNVTGGTNSSLTLTSVQPIDTGIYTAVMSTSGGATTSNAAILGVNISTKVIGTGSELAANIAHPNGKIFDQILIDGAAASMTADAGQVLRTSLIDQSGDIVQLEFSGAGTLSIVIDGASTPAPPANYNQTNLYVKGHVGVVVTGADETTNLGVFSVGRGTAVNQGLFKDTVTYDGFADIAYIAISSPSGKFGGLRAANASFFATKGFTGLYAPGIAFQGPVFLNDINAFDAATPVLVIGSSADVRITGGDLLQTNGRAIQVAGLTQLKMSDGTTSHYRVEAPSPGEFINAKANRARLEQNGVDVTAQIVMNPGP